LEFIEQLFDRRLHHPTTGGSCRSLLDPGRQQS
jgi:hypothetical protein